MKTIKMITTTSKKSNKLNATGIKSNKAKGPNLLESLQLALLKKPDDCFGICITVITKHKKQKQTRASQYKHKFNQQNLKKESTLGHSDRH